jgi:hypothetical protein
MLLYLSEKEMKSIEKVESVATANQLFHYTVHCLQEHEYEERIELLSI